MGEAKKTAVGHAEALRAVLAELDGARTGRERDRARDRISGRGFLDGADVAAHLDALAALTTPRDWREAAEEQPVLWHRLDGSPGWGPAVGRRTDDLVVVAGGPVHSLAGGAFGWTPLPTLTPARPAEDPR